MMLQKYFREKRERSFAHAFTAERLAASRLVSRLHGGSAERRVEPTARDIDGHRRPELRLHSHTFKETHAGFATA